MAIDRCHIGYSFPPFTVQVEAQRLKQFAHAIGEQCDEELTMSASPTFMKVIEGAHDSSRAILAELQVDLRRVLHAEQQFEYHLPIRAGDHLTITRTVTDIYEKKDGAMEFIVIESVAAQPNGAIAARSRQVILVRSPAPEANA